MMTSSRNLRNKLPNTGALWRNNDALYLKEQDGLNFHHILYTRPRANFINAGLDCVLGDLG
jgi:hypothetical protein